MGLFEKLFPKPKTVSGSTWYELINGYNPTFRTWTGSIYENELVSSAIEIRATHISKAQVHVTGSAKKGIKGKIEKAPNGWQTWGQFLARCSTILDIHNTVIIVPVFDEYGQKTGFYPVIPSITELVEYQGEPWLRFRFANGKTGSIEMRECGILVKHQYKSDYFGEPNTMLDKTMQLISIQDQGIEEAVKSSATYRFMATLGNFSGESDLANERKRFTKDNLESGGGLLLFPNTYKDIKQINATPFVVDKDQMSLIERRVQYFFGVNDEILTNRAYGDSWSAFYEGAVEPFLIQFSDVITRMIFTPREIAEGNCFMLSANRMQYLSNSDKLAVSSQMADRGLMTRNEIRAIWNLPPLPAGIGDTLPARGEYYNVGEEENDGN